MNFVTDGIPYCTSLFLQPSVYGGGGGGGGGGHTFILQCMNLSYICLIDLNWSLHFMEYGMEWNMEWNDTIFFPQNSILHGKLPLAALLSSLGKP